MKKLPWPGILLGVAVVGSAVFAYKTLKAKDTPSPGNVLEPDQDPDTSSVNQDLGIPSGSGGSSSWISDTIYPIQKGSKGPIVEALQKILVAGGKNIVIDGYWGPETEGAFVPFFGKGQIKSDADLVNTVLSKAYKLPNVEPIHMPLLGEAKATIEKRTGKGGGGASGSW